MDSRYRLTKPETPVTNRIENDRGASSSCSPVSFWCTLSLVDGDLSPDGPTDLNILQIISGRNVNGAVTYCKFLSQQLLDQGNQVTVLCRPGGWLKEHLDPRANLVESDLRRRPLELQRTARWIRGQGFDVMHTHMSRAHTFGVLMRMMTGVPVVATAHQCSLQVHWRMNSHVIANSAWTERYQQRINRVPSDRLDTVHCFTDLARFSQVTPRDVYVVRRQLRLRDDELVLGVVGDIIPRQGQLYLFRALESIIQRVPNLKLVLLGRFHREEPYVRRLRTMQIQQQLWRRVKWLGLRDNVQDFMAAFDLCVVPSVEEPLGLVALEALAAGTPVVASEVGGLPEIIEPGRHGLLVPPRDPQALAEAVIELAGDPARRQAFGEAGQQMVAQRFDPVKLACDVEAILRRVVQRRAA